MEKIDDETIRDLFLKIKYLYDIEIMDFLLKNKDKIFIRRSPKTKRIKEIYFDNSLIMVIRAQDGFPLFTVSGAKIMLKKLKKRIIISNEIAEPISKGRTLFAKHVKYASSNIRANDEVIIVNKNGEVLATGKALLSSDEMINFNYGKAVKIRSHIRT